MITEVEQVKYIVVVNGQQIGHAHQTRHLAEAAVLHLPQGQQAVAEIVTITQSGQHLLLG